MKQHKAGWRVSRFFASSMFFLILMIWIPVIPSAAAYEATSVSAHTRKTMSVQGTLTVDPTMTFLQKKQLAQQISQQQQTWQNFFWNIGSALVSSLILIAGGFIALLRWFRERREEQRKQDEDRFLSAIEALGGARMEQKVGGAVMLRTFLRPEYKQYYSQVFDLAVAHLRALELSDEKEKSDKPEFLTSLNQALATIFKDAFLTARHVSEKRKKQNLLSNPHLFDATNVRLENAYLDGAHLEKIHMPSSYLRWAHLENAHLEGAYLKDAVLKDADLRNAHLENAHLDGAHLENAHLDGAHLENAHLDGAHLDGAYLIGAHLEGTNLLDASLKGTVIREVKDLTKDQLYYAYSLKQAIIDDTIIKHVEEHSSSSVPQPSNPEDSTIPLD